MNIFIKYLTVAGLPCCIANRRRIIKLINYQQLANSFSPQGFIFQNASRKLVTFYRNKQKDLVVANIHYQNVNYMIGPVIITDYRIGDGRAPANRPFLISGSCVRRFKQANFIMTISFCLNLLGAYYREKKLRRRFQKPVVTEIKLKRSAFVKLSINGAHVNYAFERQTNYAILIGDRAEIHSALNSLLNSGRIGVLSDKGDLRNMIDFGIICVSTNIRIALRNGMDFERAYSLNDYYVRCLEKQRSVKDVIECIEEELFDLSRQMERRWGANTPPAVVRAYHILLNNVQENISVKELAGELNMSPHYFSGLFKRWLGVSFTQFRSLAKINYSLTLLLSTNLPISQIAGQLGFNDQAYFTNMFKQYTGITPNHFRKNPLLLKDWNIYSFLRQN
ncbi:helix-turn-helix domain-containing protein [Limosilactobacillus sp.]|uniref:helix-turn-helix domain-containing protein n=1 Tax=Limosilactobacillus sp. TaxID=2773925 RepID=UPI003EFD6E39